MELLEIVSEQTGEPTGLCLPRHEAIAQLAWCRSTNVFVMNSRGETLCHQRSSNKERLPGVWFTHLGGHVGKGETYETNALKELEEEAGIKAEAKFLIPWRTVPVKGTSRVQNTRLWMRDFVFLTDEPASAFVPQPGEVDRFAWKSFEEIIENEQKYPYLWYAGIGDFHTEYHCMRSALHTAHALGVLSLPRDLQRWSVMDEKEKVFER